MKAVWSWLLSMVDADREVDADEGARALTGAGLEVESVERIGDGFSGVVVAEGTVCALGVDARFSCHDAARSAPAR